MLSYTITGLVVLAASAIWADDGAARQAARQLTKEAPLLTELNWPKDKPLPAARITDRTEKPLLKADREWENFAIGFCRVIRQGDQWHMWYISADQDYKDDSDRYLCYARSKDGIVWEKPDLGLFEYRRSKHNNIIEFGICGASVFVDDDAPADKRFKIVFNRRVKDEWWVYGGTSADGIHWKWLEAPLLRKNSDTDNVCFRDGGLYRLYARMWTKGLYAGYRIVGYSESKTFGDFPEPVAILSPNAKDPADLHLYNSAATRLGDGLYIMFPSAFYTISDTVCPLLAMGPDGRQFDRIGRNPVLPLGNGFDSKGIYVASGGIPAGVAGEYWFYYTGTTVKHDETKPGKVKSAGGIGRFRLILSENPATRPASPQ